MAFPRLPAPQAQIVNADGKPTPEFYSWLTRLIALLDTGAWTAFTPSISTIDGTGVSFSYAAGDSTYELIGKRFTARIIGQITYTTPPSKIILTLPLSLVSKGYQMVTGMNLATYDVLLGSLPTAATTVDLYRPSIVAPFSASLTFFLIGVDIEIT